MRSSGLDAHEYMTFSLMPPFGMRTNTGRPWKAPSRSPLAPFSPYTGPLNLYAPLLEDPGSWRPEKMVPSRLRRKRAAPTPGACAPLLVPTGCRHKGGTVPVPGPRVFGFGQPLSGKRASTAACETLFWLAEPPGAVEGRLACGSLVIHVALPNAKPPPGVAGFAMSATRQSRCHTYSFVRVLRSMPNITLPRSFAELPPPTPDTLVACSPPVSVSPAPRRTEPPSPVPPR